MDFEYVFFNKEYRKEEDEVYCNLLRLACVSDNTKYTEEKQIKAIHTLNQLPLYAKVHWRLLPLLNAKAKQLSLFEKLKPEVQQLLIVKAKESVITELAKTSQLNIIIEAFSSKNIPIILLKGTAFSGVLYTKESPRVSSDIDILVKEQDWHKAKNCLNNFMTQTAKTIDGVFGDLYEVTFKPTKNSGSVVDLHKSLINPVLFPINEISLWENSLTHPLLGNENVRMLMPEHALIHQAIHAYKDMNFCKYNLVDSNEIVSVQKPDIRKTISITKEWGASVPLFVLLNNCTEIMCIKVNSDLLKIIKPKNITYKIINQLLKSRFTQPIENRKHFRYRLNQIIGQFMFTGSIRPLVHHWLFVKSIFSQNIQNGIKAK